MKTQITKIMAKPELNRLRLEKGYSMEYLAELAQVTKITIFNAEHRVYGVRHYNAKAIAEALGKDILDLFEYTKHDDIHPRNGGTKKLNEQQVLEIFRSYRDGKKQICEIAREYAISRRSVYNIINKRTWKEVLMDA